MLKKRWVALATAALVSACTPLSPAVINPGGPAADRILALTWILFGLGGLIFFGVMAYLAASLLRRRKERDSPPVSLRLAKEQARIAYSGVGLTVIVLLAVFGLTIDALGAVASPENPPELTVRVVGKQWWWEIQYPEAGVTTANEIHIPVGQPVLLELRSDNVIHSFWVPQLHGKRDLIPGKVNTFWIEASQPGLYWGECAEFCGVQHARMQFVVVAESREDFDAWLRGQQQPASISDNPYYQRGWQVFLQSGCGGCHTLQGTEAQGEQGPDLTHLASRRTIAAGTLEYSPGNLAGWVADPQGIKPGNLMPTLDLPANELRALVDFLNTLE